MTDKERRQSDARQNRKLWDRGFRDGAEITKEEDMLKYFAEVRWWDSIENLNPVQALKWGAYDPYGEGYTARVRLTLLG